MTEYGALTELYRQWKAKAFGEGAVPVPMCLL